MREVCPTAWDLALGECRAGLRRWVGTTRGDNYATVLAHGGEGDASDPDPWERTLGDFLDPTLPGGMTGLVNAVSREIAGDAKGWRVDRLLNMSAMMAQERRERAGEMPGA